MKKYKILFFDLDDTLWDTLANSKEAIREVYDEFGFDKRYPSFEIFYPVYLKSNNYLWEQYSLHNISKNDVMHSRFKRLFEGMDDSESLYLNNIFMNKTSHKTRLVEGAIELLEKLKDKYNLHLISNGFSEVQYLKMEGSGLSKYFDQVILSDSVGVNKPDKYIFEYALEKTGADKACSLMIGDNLKTDIIGAYNVGLDQVWYNPENIKQDMIEPTYEVRSLEELGEILT